MKRSRFSETQIVSILGEADAGMQVKDICRKYGISDATYYNWKSKYGGGTAAGKAFPARSWRKSAVPGAVNERDCGGVVTRHGRTGADHSFIAYFGTGSFRRSGSSP